MGFENSQIGESNSPFGRVRGDNPVDAKPSKINHKQISCVGGGRDFRTIFATMPDARAVERHEFVRNGVWFIAHFVLW